MEFSNIIFVSKKHNFSKSLKIPRYSFIGIFVILFTLIVSTIILSSFNAREIFAEFNTRKSEQVNAQLLNKLDSLHNVVVSTHEKFNEHIAQDNRQRTY